MKRIGLAPWLGVVVALSGLQVGALVAATPEGGPVVPLWAAMLLVFALQLAKIPVTMGRLADLGRSLDDALLAAVPLVSIGLFFNLLRSTPSDSVRDRELAKRSGQTSPIRAFLHGLVDLWQGRLWIGPALVVHGVAVTLVEAFFGPWIVTFVQGPVPPRLMATWCGLGLAGFGLLWLAGLGVGALGGARRTRLSWAPTLLILPGLLIAAAFAPPVTENFGREAPPLFGLGAWSLLWWCSFGAVFSSVNVALAWDRRQHGAVSVRRAIAFWWPRALGATVVAGGTTTIVYLGMQLLIVPGLLYALLMAFAVHAALLHPEVPSLRRASMVSTRGWRPIFLVMALGLLVGVVVQLAALVGVEALFFAIDRSSFVDDTGGFAVGRLLFAWGYGQLYGGGLPPVPAGVGAALALVAQGASTAGLTRIYADRLGV